tara:strand:+ start:136 stop:1161 length:1026 start_codon:yes stop_codon:yes gene_type:complete
MNNKKSKIILSICIPTYNRPNHLENCLKAIQISQREVKKNFNFEVCISDNGSKHDILGVINKFKKKFKIKFHRFPRNKGITVNFLKAVDMAEGEFVWTIGNDDLLMPKTLNIISNLLKKYPKIDYYFINSYLLNLNFIKRFSHPFNTYNFPKKMQKFSQSKKYGILNFWSLIDPDVSFDFLLGMFVSMFRRKSWVENLKCLNKKNIKDKRWMSNFDNTCFNTMIFANAFKSSKAYLQNKPLCINIHGVREWTKLYAFISIVRLPEILDYYRSRGMPFWQYIKCKNFALKNFAFFIGKILISKDTRGIEYLSFYKHIIKNLIYPNVYFSLFFYIYQKIKSKL